MSKIMISCTIACFAVTGILAQAVSTPAAGPAKTTIHGTIIDNACATSHKDSLAAFIKGHTKECALMPACEASGYSIYTKEGKLHPFLRRNSAAIAEYLKVKINTLHVAVTAEMEGDSLNLESIKGVHPAVKSTEKAPKKTM